MAPSLCGSFLQNKRALVAFTWTLTVFFTLLAFIVTTAMVLHVHSRYNYWEKYYEEQYEENDEQHSGDREKYEHLLTLNSMQSGSLTFVAGYTMLLAIALSMYGSTTIVGFTSLRGVYIAPCFSGPSSLKLGIFGGAIILFANLLLVCAVIFGEVRVRVVRR